MSPLFLRIWLSFWAVLLATFLAALAINFGLAVHRARSLDTLSLSALAADGAHAISAGGDEGGRSWLLRERILAPELRILIVGPDGRELSGRAPAEVAHLLARRRPGRSFPAEADGIAAGRPYRFVFYRASALDFDLWDILLQPWLLVFLVLAISGLGAAWLARSFARPVRRIEAGVGRIAGGALDTRMGSDLAARRDEIGTLARGIDHMTERLAALIAAREVVLRDVSHELRGPLARLRAAADLARRQGHAPDATFGRINKEVDRLDGLVGQILRFARLQASPAFELRPIDLTALAAESVEDARLEAESAGKTIEAEVEEGLAILGDEALLRSALDNVLRNAVRFSPPAGAVRVTARRKDGILCIAIEDRGPGVPPAELPHIFEAFHGEGSGAGLGLAIVRRVAELHGGAVAARNREEGGLVVSLELSAFDAG